MEFYLAQPTAALFKQQIGQMMHLVCVQMEVTFAAYAVNHDILAREVIDSVANHSFGELFFEAGFVVDSAAAARIFS